MKYYISATVDHLIATITSSQCYNPFIENQTLYDITKFALLQLFTMPNVTIYILHMITMFYYRN